MRLILNRMHNKFHGDGHTLLNKNFIKLNWQKFIVCVEYGSDEALKSSIKSTFYRLLCQLSGTKLCVLFYYSVKNDLRIYGFLNLECVSRRNKGEPI